MARLTSRKFIGFIIETALSWLLAFVAVMNGYIPDAVAMSVFFSFQVLLLAIYVGGNVIQKYKEIQSAIKL